MSDEATHEDDYTPSPFAQLDELRTTLGTLLRHIRECNPRKAPREYSDLLYETEPVESEDEARYSEPKGIRRDLFDNWAGEGEQAEMFRLALARILFVDYWFRIAGRIAWQQGFELGGASVIPIRTKSDASAMISFFLHYPPPLHHRDFPMYQGIIYAYRGHGEELLREVDELFAKLGPEIERWYEVIDHRMHYLAKQSGWLLVGDDPNFKDGQPYDKLASDGSMEPWNQPLGSGDWLMPAVSLRDLAVRLDNIDWRTARKQLLPFRLRQYGSSQRWTVDMTNMNDDLRRKVTGEKRPMQH